MLLGKHKKLILTNMIGTAMEIYDISIYAYFAPLIAAIFFPAMNSNLALLNTFLIFSLSFIVRPIGGIVFGHIGDTIGRKASLLISISLISLATFAMGLLPVTHQIGIAAPILLALLRSLQGFSFSGEYTGSVLFLMEQAPIKHRGFVTSWTVCGGNLGLLFASFICFLVTHYFSAEQVMAFGWRIPFLLGLIGGIVSLYLRYHIQETSIIENPLPLPLLEVCLRQKAVFLKVLSLTCFYMVISYLIFIWSTTDFTHNLHLSMNTALAITSSAIALQLFFIPLVAALSDKIGRTILLKVGIISLAIAIYPYYLLLETGNLIFIVIAQFTMVMLANFFMSVYPIAISEILPVKTRFTNAAFAYNLAGIIAGGTTPLMAMYFIQMPGGAKAVSLYFIIWAAIAWLGVIKLS